MANEDFADVFAFPDYNLSSKLLTLSSGSDSQFFNTDLPGSNKSAEGHITVKPANADVDGFFKLPDSLTPIDLNGFDETDCQIAPIPETLHDANLHDLDVFDESWLLKDKPARAEFEYKTWDDFLVPDAPQPVPLFITEAGPGTYDATIKHTEDPLNIGDPESNVIQTSPYLTALLGLAFGRGSVFFTWDENKAGFILNLDKMRISGYSLEVLQGLQQCCLECGNTTRFLSTYVQAIYETRPGAVRVAIAKAVDMTLMTIQKILGARARHIRSLLQLKSLIQPIQTVLAYFKNLILNVSKTKTDEQALSLIFEEAQSLEHTNAALSEVMREVLSRVSTPWTQFAEKWIGVRTEGGVPLTKEDPGNSFIKVGNIQIVDDLGFETDELDYMLDEERMPTFVPSEVALVIFETGKTLRLLRTHHPEHPICQMELITKSNPPPLQWHFNWKSIERFREDVKAYEQSLSKSLQHQSTGGSAACQLTGSTDSLPNGNYTWQFFGHGETELEGQLLASIAALDKPPTTISREDNLARLLNDDLFKTAAIVEQGISDFSPHWSLIPYYSFGPLVAAQARVINREYMKLLFSAHHLRDHLSLQKQFHLLGNGMFCSRLSHALFDPNLDTAERQTGVALSGGTMGLRLSGRDTWPPASSELRLTLMGVLAENFLPSSPQTAPSIDGKYDLPGDISFGVRDLSSEEVDKCLDPGSLEALDFLRLLYKPPAPLSPIFTPVILLKYDKIFRLLLKVLRMLYVVEQLFRDTLARTSNWYHISNTSIRFRFEAHNFVTSISSYFFDTGIEMPWKQFENRLADIENNLSKSDLDPQDARILSPDELREEQERLLDRIMHTLLLRKRQQPVMKLLEDIFSIILKFSGIARLEASGNNEGKTEGLSPKSLYDAFKKKVDIFITVCRALQEKGGLKGKPTANDIIADDGRRGEDVKEENTIDKLLIKLDMSGYYGHLRN
ncbi:Spc98 family-domain-containing protein [Daldinia vernicosa]|uniref:Spc98 family-domain-containing protein n=1 Tax=Daldinia vernicosa TaxID=114800 RepID=UPI002007A59E|nr:Spc98 family-domain-containing protein [Daldinia vernicosa]KAI0844717.1 Spc98 family-domain-containing protein [Daldinia vernicosa]